jgi:DNA-binding NtrC family response regulator
MSQSFRVLLVEDDDSLRVCLDEYFASRGWSVTATAFGKEAIMLARSQRFDFSILDFHLPETTGLEVFRTIAATRPLPAILMSGLASADEAAQAMQAGVFSFLRKPLDLDHLRRAVETLIQHHFGGPIVPAPGKTSPGRSSASRTPAPRRPAPGRRPPKSPN